MLRGSSLCRMVCASVPMPYGESCSNSEGLLVDLPPSDVSTSSEAVDTDDDGLPEEDASLEAIGLDTLERATLASWAPSCRMARARRSRTRPRVC